MTHDFVHFQSDLGTHDGTMLAFRQGHGSDYERAHFVLTIDTRQSQN